MDMISNLPDEIICHIVSFLSAKEAAFASVLSKRWRNHFNIIPSLCFTDYNKKGSLMEFVEGIMALPLSSRIRECSLTCRCNDPVLMNRFLCNVLKRGVLSFKLDLFAEKGYSLPFEVFTCNTIVELKLGSCLVIDVLPKNIFLPALETLCLDSVRFYDLCGCAFETLLSACPLLKELTIHGVDWESSKWSHIVSSPTLERLTIYRVKYEGFNGSDFRSITFDTPSLIFLEISDFVPEEYSIVNLESLVEAKLLLSLTVDHSRDFHFHCFIDEDDSITSDPTNLIQGLRNVEILDLEDDETMEMFYIFRGAIPVFEKLHRLTFDSDNGLQCWRFLPFLLQKTPNLKTLVIKGSLHWNEYDEKPVCKCLSGYSCLLSCPVEVLEISRYIGDFDELEQVKHFLGKLSCLELLIVRADEYSDDKDKLRITTDLQMLQRASVNCKIQVEFT